MASEQPGLSQDQVSACLRSFYASLFSVSTPLIERLQDLELREHVRVQTSEKISEAYSKVCPLRSSAAGSMHHLDCAHYILCNIFYLLSVCLFFVVVVCCCCGTYRQVHAMLLIDSNAYRTENVLTHTVQEVQVLLGYSSTS